MISGSCSYGVSGSFRLLDVEVLLGNVRAYNRDHPWFVLLVMDNLHLNSKNCLTGPDNAFLFL